MKENKKRCATCEWADFPKPNGRSPLAGDCNCIVDLPNCFRDNFGKWPRRLKIFKSRIFGDSGENCKCWKKKENKGTPILIVK